MLKSLKKKKIQCIPFLLHCTYDMYHAAFSCIKTSFKGILGVVLLTPKKGFFL